MVDLWMEKKRKGKAWGKKVDTIVVPFIFFNLYKVNIQNQP